MILKKRKQIISILLLLAMMLNLWAPITNDIVKANLFTSTENSIEIDYLETTENVITEELATEEAVSDELTTEVVLDDDLDQYDESGNWIVPPSDMLTMQEILKRGMQRAANTTFVYLDSSDYANYIGYTQISGTQVSLKEKRSVPDGNISYCLDYYKQLGANKLYSKGSFGILGKAERYVKTVIALGYPSVNIAKLKTTHNLEINTSSAEQATQMALWILMYYAYEGCTLEQAISKYGIYQTPAATAKGYEPVKLVKSLCRDVINVVEKGANFDDYTASPSESKNYFIYTTKITPKNMIGGYDGEIRNLPIGTVLYSKSSKVTSFNTTTWKFSSESSNTTDTIKLSIPKHQITDEFKVEFKLKGMPYIPEQSDSVLYWEPAGDYQPIAEIKTSMPGIPGDANFTVKKPKAGSGSIIKFSEDGIIQGMQFQATGSVPAPPNPIPPGYIPPPPKVYTATTDANGIADFGQMELGSYLVEEINVPDRYVTPRSQRVTVLDGTIANLYFENILKKIKIKIIKTDRETGVFPQGDAQLAGAVYGVFDGTNMVDTIVIGADPLGVGWSGESEELPTKVYTVKEIVPPIGYLLDTTVYTTGTAPGAQTIELTGHSVLSAEQVIKGKIKIFKELNNPDPNDDTMIPAGGVQFTYYLNSNPSITFTLTLDQDGIGETGLLPYGLYTLDEVKAPDGWKKIMPRSVFIQEDQKVYKYYLSDLVNETWIKVFKKDIETGKIIPYANTGFKVWDKQKNDWVVQHLPYPSNLMIDEFYTNSDGWLMMPEKLLFGDYELHEIQAPWGYYRKQEPIPFHVDGNFTEITEVTCSNIAQKGDLLIHKTGTVLTGCEEQAVQVPGIKKVREPVLDANGKPTLDPNGNPIEKEVEINALIDLPVLVPKYEEIGIIGAEYTITALEDIITPEGTLRMAAGETKVFASNKDGLAACRGLYLGKYQIQETQNPNGYVIDPTIWTIEITYAGQEIELQRIEFDKYNKRQKPAINLLKSIPGGNEDDVMFGLFAREPIGAQLNSKQILIPQDVILDVFKIKGGKGDSMFQTFVPFGKYYFKEIKTAATHILDTTEYDFVFTNDKEFTTDKLVDVLDTQGKPVLNPDGTVKQEMQQVKEIKKDNETEDFMININNGQPIVNKPTNPGGGGGYFPTYGTIRINKYRQGTTTGLAGSKFRLEYENGNVYAEWVSDGKEHVINNISPGTYYLVEIEAPEGYIKSEDKIKVVVEANQTNSTAVENDFTKVDISKVNITTGKELPGAEMEIKNANGDVIYQWTTGKKPKRIEMLKPGDYTLWETTAPDGYLIADKIEFTVEATGKVQKIVMKDDYYGFISIQKSGNLPQNIKLAGAEFGIYKEDGTLIEVLVTDEEGQATIKVASGNYYVQERKAPKGYKISPEKHSVIIDQAEKTVKLQLVNNALTNQITIKNSKIIPKPSNPMFHPHLNTGDSRSIIPIVGIMGTAFITYLIFTPRKKEK